jgi:tRNA (guanosine-2'-O-)-methyltransferase
MKYPHLNELISQANHQELKEKITPFIGETRLQKIQEVVLHRLSSLHLAIEHPSNINNAMAAIRTAESLGVYHIHIIAPEYESDVIKIITQGAFFWVKIHFYEDLDAFLSTLKHTFDWPSQMHLAGAALSDTACSLSDVPIDQPLCILVGNEQRGLTDKAKAACQYCFMIPMVGMSQSFNLSVAAAISLYDTSQRKRALLSSTCDLTLPEKECLESAYLLSSVDCRLAEHLLKTHPKS